MLLSEHGLKLRQLFKFLHALFDVGAFDFGRARQAKSFAAERRGNAAVNHRAPDVRVNRAHGRLAKNPIMPPTNRSLRARSGQRPSCSGYAGQMKNPFGPDKTEPCEPCSILMMTYFGTESVDFWQRGEDVVLLRELMRLAVVQHEAVNARQEFQQIVERDVQPQIHRVGHDELRLVHLVEQAMLERGRDVAEQDELGILIRFRQCR